MSTDNIPKISALDGYLTASEMAKELGLHPSTLAKWRMVRRGPPFVRMGKRIMYSIVSFRIWLDTCEVVPVLNRGR